MSAVVVSPGSRSYTWASPTLSEQGPESGLAFLMKVAAGELPQSPMAATMGMRLEHVEPGVATFTVEYQEWHSNEVGIAHGGMCATVLDAAMGCAIFSRVPAGTSYATVDLAVTYVRAVGPTRGPLRCEGLLVSYGRTLAVARGEVTDCQGKLIATGTTSCLLKSEPQGSKS